LQLKEEEEEEEEKKKYKKKKQKKKKMRKKKKNNNNKKTESTKKAVEKYKCNVFYNSETATNSILTQFYMAFVSQYINSYISTKHEHCTLHH
jgi:sorbitol-specific phosphotransferase system component IIBC